MPQTLPSSFLGPRSWPASPYAPMKRPSARCYSTRKRGFALRGGAYPAPSPSVRHSEKAWPLVDKLARESITVLVVEDRGGVCLLSVGYEMCSTENRAYNTGTMRRVTKISVISLFYHPPQILLTLPAKSPTPHTLARRRREGLVNVPFTSRYRD